MRGKYSYVIVLLLLFPVVWPVVAYSSVGCVDGLRATAGLTDSLRDDIDQQAVVLEFESLILVIDVIEAERRVLITFENEGAVVTEEIIVTPIAEGYETSIYIDGRLLGRRVSDLNILEPVGLTPVDPDTLAVDTQPPSDFQASYTYKWWDSIYYVTGPTWQIKYPHPDRNYYSIATYNDWSRSGSKLIHTQFNDLYSSYLAGVGWAGIFAAIGAYLGLRTQNTYAVVIGAVIGAMLGLYVGYVTQAQLVDEEGCMWWWSSMAFENWVAANAWWIWFFNLMGTANAFVWTAFCLYGYLRIGSHTFYDAVGAGSP